MSTVTPRQAVYAHLRADTNVSVLVGFRIYHQTPPLDAVYPLITLNTISNIDRRDLSAVFACDTRIQVTVMASTLKEAEDIAMAVRRSLEGFSGMMADALQVIGCRVENYMPIYQDEVGQTHYHVDVVLTHKGGA